MVVEQAKKTIKKTATATKTVATAKTKSAAADKTKNSKTSAATAAKKTATAATKAKQAKTPAVKVVTAATVTKKAPAQSGVATKKAVSKLRAAPAGKAQAQPTPEERYRMIELAAYFIAERSGFQGCASTHWVDAEREIAAKLGQ